MLKSFCVSIRPGSGIIPPKNEPNISPNTHPERPTLVKSLAILSVDSGKSLYFLSKIVPIKSINPYPKSPSIKPVNIV